MGTERLEFELGTILAVHKQYRERYVKIFSALLGMDSGYASDWIYQWVHSTDEGRDLLEADTIEHLYSEEIHDGE